MRKWFVVGCWLLCSAQGHSQVTLSDCVEQALAHNPGLRVAGADSSLAGEDLAQARAARLPSLDFSGSYRRQSAVPEMKITPIQLPFGGGAYSPFPGGGFQLGTFDNFDFKMTVSQPLFTGFRLSQRVQATQAHVQAASEDLNRQRAELIARVENAYGVVLKTAKILAIAQSGKEQVAAHVQDVQNFVDQGLLKKEELLKAQVKLSEAELLVVQAENGCRMSRTVLENLTGRTLSADATWADMPVPPQEPRELQAAIAQAMTNRLELRVLNANRGAATAVKKIARGNRLPAMAAFGTVGYGKPGLDLIKKEWMDYWVVGVAAEWKLWNGGQTRSQIQQSAIRINALDEMARQIRDGITLDVTQAFLQLQEVQQRLSVSRTLEQQALESYRVAELQYRQGVSTQTDFFDAQSVLTRSRLSLAQADIDWCLALTNWRRALGVIEKPYVK